MTTIQILYVTADEIVLWKPAGLASELPRDPSADSLVTRLNADGFSDLRLVHRLDSPTCGLMIVARTPTAAAHYSAEIAARRWHKLYVAEVALDTRQAQRLLGRHKAYLSTEGRRGVVVRSGGKPSFLSVVHAAPAEGGRSHLLVQLHTGRFHQIRVMLAALGAPLYGDTLYGSPHGAFYLEHVVLGARLAGDTRLRAWRAPVSEQRPAWDASLADAVDAEAARLSDVPAPERDPYTSSATTERDANER